MIPPNMKNPNLGTKSISDYKWGDRGIPTRENCDLNNPREMFLWMFTAMPTVNGAPLVLPPEFFMMVSEHLYELGARLVAEPLKKYRPPTSSDPHWTTSPGQWVPIDDPDPEPEDPAKEAARRAWNKLSAIQKAELREIANAEHEGRELPYSPDSPARKVWDTLVPFAKEQIRLVANEEHESDPQ